MECLCVKTGNPALWPHSVTTPGLLPSYVPSHFSHFRLFATPKTVACQAPLSVGILQARMPCLPLGHLPDPGIEAESPTSPASVGRFFTTRTTWLPMMMSSDSATAPEREAKSSKSPDAETLVQRGLHLLTHTLPGRGCNWKSSGHMPDQNLLRRVN